MTFSYDLQIGCRIEDAEGFKGTVLYVGTVAASKVKDELWIGSYLQYFLSGIYAFTI